MRRIDKQIAELNNEYKEYYKAHINDEDADGLIPESYIKAVLQPMLETHRTEKAERARQKALVDEFMSDIDTLIRKPHLKKQEIKLMDERAVVIDDVECNKGVRRLRGRPLLADRSY